MLPAGAMTLAAAWLVAGQFSRKGNVSSNADEVSPDFRLNENGRSP